MSTRAVIIVRLRAAMKERVLTKTEVVQLERAEAARKRQADRLERDQAARNRLTDRERAALRFIVRRPYANLRDLAAELGVHSVDAASHQLSRLRSRGLVRPRLLIATPEGVGVAAELGVER